MDPAEHDADRLDETRQIDPVANAPRRPAAHRARVGLIKRLRGPLVALAILAVAAGVFVVVRHHPRAEIGGTSAAAYPSLPANASRGAPTSSPTSGVSATPTVTASAPPKPTHSTSHVATPPTPATSTRKGVAAWTFNGVDKALTDSGASWYYTWSTGHNGIDTPHAVEFVPMIWGAGSVTDNALAQAKAAGKYLLGFNEPDLSSQANMSVTQALDLWPKLTATGLTLGSPAVASGGADPGGWLDQFMSGAKQRGYRVDFIALHWYGGDFTTSAAVSQLRSYLQAVYDRYHKPIWLTEFALINFSNGTHYPSESAQAAFLTAATKMLDGLPFLQRYAWFALPASDSGPSTGLFQSGPKVTDVGRAFEAAR
jgi:hypothetical protein